MNSGHPITMRFLKAIAISEQRSPRGEPTALSEAISDFVRHNERTQDCRGMVVYPQWRKALERVLRLAGESVNEFPQVSDFVPGTAGSSWAQMYRIDLCSLPKDEIREFGTPFYTDNS